MVSSPAGGDGVLPLSWQVRQVRERLCLSQEDLGPPAGDAAAQSMQAVRLALHGRTVAADSGLAGAGRGYAPSG